LGFTQARKENVIRVWDLATGKECPSLALDLGEERFPLKAISRDGKTLALAKYSDTTVHLVDVAARQVVRSLTEPGPGLRVTCVEFTADGKTLLVFCEDQ